MPKIDRFLRHVYAALLMPAWSPYFDDQTAFLATKVVAETECAALKLTRDAEDIRWQARHPEGCECSDCG